MMEFVSLSKSISLLLVSKIYDKYTVEKRALSLIIDVSSIKGQS
jgi:hypothetical protein